ncbi:hypothetical protein [Sediminicoccus rosea]|uniref:Uncharacterized protein n=1 Tax=Sediminicoccus rosea TaxID=1225128 RepID=A0ABZ0PF83_9PROT|nr:hypothetical protein [Sediminicoccus rosea]WPB83946.1 hypothetical protein R9Z33_17765 [Sediminicoccus rosea]
MIEERVLHLAGGISGLGDMDTYSGGRGRPGRPLTARDRQTLLDAATAAERAYVCELALRIDRNTAGPGGAPAMFWFDFGNDDRGGRGYFALGFMRPGFGAIALNAAAFPTIDEQVQHTVVHEAWHAVQGAMFPATYLPHWMLEGQADAMAIRAMERAGLINHPARLRRLARQPGELNSFVRFAGARRYDRTLAIDMDPARYPNELTDFAYPSVRLPIWVPAYWLAPHGGAVPDRPVFQRGMAWRSGYLTQSFWHWLVRQRGGNTVMNSVMTTPPAGTTEADWVTWLDRGLRASGGWPGGVAEAYGHFIAEMADLPERYVHSRSGHLAFPLWEALLWQEGCTRVLLRAEYGESTATHRLRVDPIAARCIHVKVEGFGPTAPDIAGRNSVLLPQTVAAPDVLAAQSLPPPPPLVGITARVINGERDRCDAAAQLGLGSRGTHLLSFPRPTPGSGPEAGRVCDRRWNVMYAPLTLPGGGQATGGWQTVLLSNVDPRNPAETGPVEVELFFSLQFSSISASGTATPGQRPEEASRPAPRRLPPGRPREAPPIPQPTPVTHEDPAEAGACDAPRRAAIACGPLTRIRLVGGRLGELLAAAGASSLGGALASTVGDLGTLQLDGLTPDPMDGPRLAAQRAAMQAFSAAAQAAMLRQPGGAAPESIAINIEMPRLPPGFTGVVEPVVVALEWSDGTREGVLESRGPLGVLALGLYPPRGRLEITANSPEAGLAGRFEAPLFEDRNPEGSAGAAAAMPPLTEVARIAGRFGAIPATVRDETDKTDPDEHFFRAWPRWWETMPRHMRPMAAAAGWGQSAGGGPPPASAPAPASTGGGAALPLGPGCDCSCGARATTPAIRRLACLPECRAAWAGCGTP